MSSSEATVLFPVPEGYHQPLASISGNDHTAWIVITTTLGLVYGLLFGAFRWFVRWTICPGVGLDDLLAALATGFQIAQAGIILAACSAGLGRAPELISASDRVSVQKSYYSSTLLFLLAIGFTKASCLLFLQRLATRTFHSNIFKISSVVIAAWTIVALLVEALQCNLSHPWLVLGQECTGAYTRWVGISAIDILTEVALVGLTVVLVWPLQAKRFVKSSVIATFAFRLLIIIPISLRLSSFNDVDRNEKFPFSDSRYILFTQTHLCYAIISATIPTLRPFATSMNTQFGGFGQEEGTYAYSHNHSKNSRSITVINDRTTRQESFALQSMNSAVSKRISATGPKVTTRTIFPEQHERYVCESSKGDDQVTHREAGSFDSEESQQMIIRKDVTFYVEHESSDSIKRA